MRKWDASVKSSNRNRWLLRKRISFVKKSSRTPQFAQNLGTDVLTTMVILALCGFLSVSGSARAQSGVVLPLPPDDQQRISTLLGPGVVRSPLPSVPIQDASLYFPLQERALTYQVTAGTNAGTTQTLGLSKAHRPNGKAAWRFQMAPSLSAFISQTPTGDLVMPTVSDPNEGVVVITTPANPFVPMGMQPGETRSYSQTVSVNYLDDPTDQKYSGSLNGTYTYIGTYEVTVPAGTYQTVLFRVNCEGRVGPAHTQNTAYNFFAPGVGIVAMIMQEDVSAFWIYNIDSTSGKVLLSR